MAIYGLNFNGQEIPLAIRKKFAKEKPLYQCKCGIRLWRPTGRECDVCHTLVGTMRGQRALLQGVAQSIQEKENMLIQTDNGHRTLFAVPRATAAGTWYGIYVY